MLLINEKLHLIPLTVDDDSDIFQCVEHNRQLLHKYLYWVETVTDVASCRQYIDERANSNLSGKQWHKVMYQDRVSGVFAVKSIDSHGVAEVGYWLSEAVHGQGIIALIIKKLVELACGFGISCIEFRCLKGNLASIGVAKRCGAVKEGMLESFLVLDGEAQDLDIYRLRL